MAVVDEEYMWYSEILMLFRIMSTKSKICKIEGLLHQPLQLKDYH